MSEQTKKDRDFSKMVMGIALPIMVQNGITSFVNLLDNLMVGQVGTMQMSAVSIVNQLFFIFNLTVTGSLAGAGIYTSQFFGKRDTEGVQQTVRFKTYIATVVLIIAMAAFTGFGPQLIGLYLAEGDSRGRVSQTLNFALDYLHILMIGFIPFAYSGILSSTLRECGHTPLPMKAGVAAILTNLVFNWLLIFGHRGLPRLGVNGAAIATVISRFVEFFVMFIGVKLNKEKYFYFNGLFNSFKIKPNLAKQITLKGIPLMINDSLWGTGTSMVVAAYASRGLHVVAAYNISNTVGNFFNSVFLAMGIAASIIIGHELGADRKEQAYDYAIRLLKISVKACLGLAVLIAATSLFVPNLYNTEPEVKALAAKFIIVYAFYSTIQGYIFVSYNTLRSGGKTFITFLFDSGFVCCVVLPVAYCLTHFTTLPILTCYILVCCVDLIKVVLGTVLIRKKIWVVNMVSDR